MKISSFGKKMSSRSGILQLMDDMGKAMAGGRDLLLLGGGNPAHIPRFEKLMRRRMKHILEHNDEFERMIGNYDSPQGEEEFIEVLAAYFRDAYGWNITRNNICLSNGSQCAFFFLLNLFSGSYEDGSMKKILFPLTPEYIGYADQAIAPESFTARKPALQMLDDHTFKYTIDFASLNIDATIGAIAVSRPTNPTGNVLTDEEITKLLALAKSYEIPLLIDNAYGAPFPGIIFREVEPLWDEQLVLGFSLSKLGIPGVRTGIVIANEKVIQAFSAMNAIISLAPNSIGPELVMELIKERTIDKVCRDVIRPFYEKKSRQAIAWINKELKGLPYYLHTAEGSIFLWLWLKDLPITSQELYQRLKTRNVLVVPGHYFFFSIGEWKHKHECIRINYSQEEETVKKGIAIIADVVREAYEN